MPAFLALVEFLVAVGIVISAVSSYLIINKLWKRRAHKEVAESISIAAALLGLFTAVPFLIMFMLIDHSLAGALKTAIGIATGVVFVLVGSGLFVPELRERGFGSLFLRALKLERKESGDLIKQLVQPKAADRILRILHQLASVDGHVDEQEARLIRDFADRWRIPVPEDDSNGLPHHVDLITLRKSVDHYLAAHPPPKQAGQLLDLLQVLAEADEKVTWQEAVALEEAGGMLRQYVAGEDTGVPTYEVLIVPQSEQQVEAVRTLLPDREEKMLRGGRVFSVGYYFSPRYAEVVCQKYISIGLFTTIVADDEDTSDLPALGPPPRSPAS